MQTLVPSLSTFSIQLSANFITENDIKKIGEATVILQKLESLDCEFANENYKFLNKVIRN